MKRSSFLLSLLMVLSTASYAENISTPLFTADIRNVITMYAAPDAQTFYLHTEDSLYTVSREGQILSIVPSKVKYGCCEDSVLYIHEEYDNHLLTQSGDTILGQSQYPHVNYSGWLSNARFMCRKDGVFYWYRGVTKVRQGGSRSTCFYAVSENGAPENICWWNGPFSGCAIIDDWFVMLQNGGFRLLYLPDPDYDDLRTLHRSDEFYDPIGLVSYDDELLGVTVHGFRIFSGSFLFCGLAIFGSSFFTALNDGVTSAIISFMRTLVFELASLLLLPLVFGGDGVWYSAVVAEVMAVVLSGTFLVIKRKRYGYY